MNISSIVNQSSSDIQIYTACTNSSSAPSSPAMAYYIGAGSSADPQPTTIVCGGGETYIVVGVWGPAATSGSANSWVVYNASSGKVVDSEYTGFTITFSNGQVLVGDGTGSTTTSGGGLQAGTIILLILLIVVSLIVIAAIGYGVWTYMSMAPTAMAPTAMAPTAVSRVSRNIY